MKKMIAMTLLGGLALGSTANASTICVCVGIGGAGGGCGSNAMGGNFGQYFTNINDETRLKQFLPDREAEQLSRGSSTKEYSSRTGWLCTRERR